MKRKNKTPYTILGMLTISPMTGYDIRKTIQKTTANIWSESLGQIYPALAKLEQQKQIVAVKSNNKNERNSKKYKITAKGLQSLQEWLPKSAEGPVFRDELMLKLFFGKNMSAKDCLKHVAARRAHLEQDLEYLTEVKRHIETEHAVDIDSPYWLLCISSGIYGVTAALKWCDEAEKVLQKI